MAKEKDEVVEVEKPIMNKLVWGVGEVATETQPVLVNQESGEQLSSIEALAKLMNDIEDLKKLIG